MQDQSTEKGTPTFMVMDDVAALRSQVEFAHQCFKRASSFFQKVHPTQPSGREQFEISNLVQTLRSRCNPLAIRTAMGTYTEGDTQPLIWNHNLDWKTQVIADNILGQIPQLHVNSESLKNGVLDYYGRQISVLDERGLPITDAVEATEITVGLLAIKDPPVNAKTPGKVRGYIDLHPTILPEGAQATKVTLKPAKVFFSENRVGEIPGVSEKETEQFLSDFPSNFVKLFPQYNVSTLPLESKFYLWRIFQHANEAPQFTYLLRGITAHYGLHMLYFLQAIEGNAELCRDFIMTFQDPTHRNEVGQLLESIATIEMFTGEETAAQYGSVDEVGEDNFHTLNALTKRNARSLFQNTFKSFFRNGKMPNDEEWKYIRDTYVRFFSIMNITSRRRTKEGVAVKEEIPFDLLKRSFDYAIAVEATELMHINALWFIAQALENQDHMNIEERRQWTEKFYQDIAPIIYQQEQADKFVDTLTEVHRLTQAHEKLFFDKTQALKVASMGIGRGRVELKYLEEVKALRAAHPEKYAPIGQFYGVDMMDLSDAFNEAELGVTFIKDDVATFWKNHPGELDYIMLNWSPLNNQSLMILQIYYAYAMNKALKMGGKVSCDTAAVLPTDDRQKSFWADMQDFHKKHPYNPPGSRERKPEYKMGNEPEDEVGTFSYFHEWYVPMMKALGFKLLNGPEDLAEFKRMLDHFATGDSATLVQESKDNSDPMKNPIWASPALRWTPIFEKIGEINMAEIQELVKKGAMPQLLADALLSADAAFQKADENIT